jgi:predicted transcriptional regulator
MLLVSVRPRFAEAILSGTKRVELRRRTPRIGHSETVLVYATVPTAALVGAFEVETVQRLPLDDLWRRVKDIAEVTRDEFTDYFQGLTEGVGIFVTSTMRFEHPVPLAELRRLWKGFHPPQGFRYIESCDLNRLADLDLIATD